MKSTTVMYLGRTILKEPFRAFVYSPEHQKKIVNSWHEFEIAMASGLWFATEEQAQNSVKNAKAKKMVKDTE